MTRTAELDEVIAEMLTIYPELAQLPTDYAPADDDHWSVHMLCEMYAEYDEIEGLEECELCPNLVEELYTRIDNRDFSEVQVCETCASTRDLSYPESIDA